MRQELVDSIMIQYKGDIPKDKEGYLRSQLLSMADVGYHTVACVDTKSPTKTAVLSVLLGGWGADRFYIGDIVLGILKVLLCLMTMNGSLVWYYTTSSMASMVLPEVVKFYESISILGELYPYTHVLGLIWWIIDCFCSYKKAKKKNLDNILEAVQPYIYAQPQKKNGW